MISEKENENLNNNNFSQSLTKLFTSNSTTSSLLISDGSGGPTPHLSNSPSIADTSLLQFLTGQHSNDSGIHNITEESSWSMSLGGDVVGGLSDGIVGAADSSNGTPISAKLSTFSLNALRSVTAPSTPAGTLAVRHGSKSSYLGEFLSLFLHGYSISNQSLFKV